MLDRAPVDPDLARRMLACVDPHDREVWVQVGKALAAEFGSGGEWVYREWSERAENFTERGFRDTWRSCLRKPGRYTAGTLVALAQRGGFRFERPSLSPEQRQRLEALRTQAAARRVAQERAREVEQVSAQRRAHQQWREASRQGVSLYAERKGISAPESVRYAADGGLLIPMVRPDLPVDQALRGLQRIGPDGAKRFTAGMDKPGTCCRLGLLEVGQPLLLCEGWATGMSLRMALASLGRALPVFVAFDAGNLGEVSRLLAGLHRNSVQLICADDDWQTRDSAGLPINPGRRAAYQARDAVLAQGGRALAVTPVWRGQREPGWTDFNDLHASRGLSAVASQLSLALDAAARLWRPRRNASLKHG